MEIAPGIHRIEAPLGERFVCLYLLIGSQRSLLIDTGLASMIGGVLAPYMESIGFDPAQLDYVLISHADFDHTGGAAAVRALAPRAVFMCHEFDRPMIEDVETIIAQRYGQYRADHGFDETGETKAFIRKEARHIPMDLSVRGGEVLHLGSGWHIEILHTPGHSRGHVSVHDPRSRTMIILDAALWNAVLTKAGAPAFPPTYRYPETYRATIQLFQSYPLEVLATSHYPLYRGAGPIGEFLGESAAYVDRVERALRGALDREQARTLLEVIAEISPTLGGWSEEAGQYLIWSLTGHFEQMANAGLLEVDRRGGLVAARWAG